MPGWLERKLKHQARKKGFIKKKGKRTILSARGRKYVFGALRNTGWRPQREQ